MNKELHFLDSVLYLIGGNATKWSKTIEKIGVTLNFISGVGILAVVTALLPSVLNIKKIIQTEAELSKSLATSGGQLGITKDQAILLRKGMKSLGIGTLKAMDAISEISKSGKIGKESLELVTKAAVDLEKRLLVFLLKKRLKKYAKLQDEPSKKLLLKLLRKRLCTSCYFRVRDCARTNR